MLQYHQKSVKIKALLNLIVFVLINFTISCEAQKLMIKDSPNVITKVVTDVVEKFYIAENIKFDFIVFGESSNHINDVINGVLKEINQDNPIIIKHIQDIDNWDYLMERSAIIFIKSVNDFLNLRSYSVQITSKYKISQFTSISTQRLKFLVYIEDLKTFEDLQFIIQKNKEAFLIISDIRHYELFIINNGNSVDLFANSFYSQQRCGFFTPEYLNSFDIKSQMWSKKLQNFDHYSNFHGCLLPFLTFYNYMLYIKGNRDIYKLHNIDGESFAKLLANKNTEFDGIINELVKILAKRLNFTFQYSLMRMGDIYSDYYGTKGFRSSVPASIVLLTADVDMTNAKTHYTNPHDFIEYYFLVSHNDLYSNYEKLLFPFDSITWMLLILIFGLTCGIIFGLRICPKRLREIVLGKNIKSPGYNALGVFFGISQLRTPHENFSRFILVIFIWICLIFRTCYQSMMFKFMTTDMRKPLPETVEDLIKYNYSIVVHNDRFDEKIIKSYTEIYLDELLSGKERPQIITLKRDKIDLLYKTALFGETDSKYAFMVNTDNHALWNATLANSLPMMGKEKISKMKAFEISRNIFFVHHLDDILSELIPAGIPQYIEKNSRWFVSRPFDNEFVDPRRILSLNDLGFGFVLWLVACFLSFLVFLCEVLVSVMSRIMEEISTLISLIGFVRILQTRMVHYHDTW